MMQRTSYEAILGLLLVLLSASPAAAQIPAIENPVTTSFGTYYPPAVEVQPDAAWYVVEPGLGNVVNALSFDLPPEAEQLLEAQAFFITTGREPLYSGWAGPFDAYKNFEDVYTEAQEAGVPAFITTDTMLHVFHRLFDHSLKTTEEGFLAAEAVELASNLADQLESVYDAADNDDVRAAARLAAGHLMVGLLLLEPESEAPAWLEPELSTELQLIEDANQRTKCPLFDAYWEDYSQYVPRGHYTRSETLKRYFKAMMWYGRMTFALREMDVLCTPLDQRPDLTAAALMLVRQMLITDGDSREIDRWHLIYDPTEFFVGESDDLQYNHYAALAESVFGAPLDQLTPAQICDAAALQTFMDRAEAELPQPRIRGNAPQGMRLFGQRFLPDSWYLSELVHDAVLGRMMPSVLDVMSVLGSVEAEELQRLAGAEGYQHYAEQLEMLREDVRGGPPERWASTLYWNWIYSIAPLLGTWGEGFPPYMQSAAWPRRQLMCAAGTWTELRHDTILYAKQSNTSPWTSPPPGAPFVQGAVEANPWLFARLGALAAYARTGLGDLGILDQQVADRLEDLELAAFLLADAAARELERRPLTNQQHSFIFAFGRWLGVVLNLEGEEEEEEAVVSENENDRSPVVADVHSDPNTESVLEEGTGYAGRIFVVADVEGRLTLTVGAAFIPFEFTHPIANRLTDEAWWQILAEAPPELPWWAEPALAVDSVAPATEAENGGGEFSLPEIVVELEAERVQRGEDLVLNCEPAATRVKVLRDGSVVLVIDVPSGSGGTVHVPTADLPLGEVTLLATVGGSTRYAVRARVTEPVHPPRRSGGRLRP